MQGRECFVQNPWVVLALVDGRRFSVQPEQVVDGRLRGADRVFDGEDHVVGQFAELAREGQVCRSFGHNLRAITFFAAAGTGW